MWQVGFSKSTLPHVPHIFNPLPVRRVSVGVRGELRCTQNSCNRLREKEAEQDVSKTGGTRMNNKSDKVESKNEDPTTGTTTYAKSLN